LCGGKRVVEREKLVKEEETGRDEFTLEGIKRRKLQSTHPEMHKD